MQKKDKQGKFVFPTRKLVFTALMTALTMVATMVLGFRAGDFFFNCGDTVIFVAAALFGPIPAMIAGGIGSFFADLILYPATMVFTLIIKGLEGLVCGLLIRLLRTKRQGKMLSAITGCISMIVSGAFMLIGYYLCNRFIYGTSASALVALSADVVQVAVSVVLACVLLYVMRLIVLRKRFNLSNDKTLTAQPYVRDSNKDYVEDKH